MIGERHHAARRGARSCSRAVGVVRFPDVLARMQALTKASTLGVVLVAVGSVFVLPTRQRHHLGDRRRASCS